MEGLINERSKIIIRSLITKGTLTLKELKSICDVSERTIAKDLDSLECIIRKYNLSLVRKPKLGIWIEGEQANKEKLFIDINISSAKIPNTPKERQDYILLKLISSSKYITMQELCDEIYISRGTLENDLDVIENIVRKNGLILKKTTNKGIRLLGDEKKLRVLIADFFSNITQVMPSNELVNHMKSSSRNMMDYSFEKELFDLFSDLDLKALQGLVSEAENMLGYTFTDVAFTSLLIHLAIAIKRVKAKNEISISEVTIENIEVSKEYEAAKFITEGIKKVFNVSLSKIECAYITIHVLGAKVQYNLLNKDEDFLNRIEFQGEIEELCKEMIDIASEVLGINFSKDMILLKGLSMHIRAALNRFLHEIPVKNPLLDSIKNSYVASFEAAVASSEAIKKKYNVIVDENEIAYITLHFEAAVERTKNNNNIKKKVVLVCSSGIGTSQLAASKLKRVFDNIEIVDIISSQNIDEDNLSEIDLLITTIPLKITKVPVIRINPLLLDEDLENIKGFMASSSSITASKKKYVQELYQLMHKSLMFIKETFTTKEEAIKELTKAMHVNGFVEEDFYETVVAREEIASTAIGRVSLPHGDMKKVYKSAICICTLKEKIDWNESKVDFIILLAIKREDILKMQNIFDGFYDVFSDNRVINKLVNSNSKEDILNLLSR